MLTLNPEMQSNKAVKPDEFTQAAQDAEVGLLYGSKVNEGINAFSELAEQRLQTPVDSKGNPAFLKFSEDTQAMAKQQAEALVKDVDSPVAKFAITQGYAKYVQGQLPGLEDKNREQQLKFYNESFYNNVKQLKDKLLNDENINIEFYKGEMQKQVGIALNAGVIDPDTAMQIQAQGEKDLVIATANQVGKKNPDLLISSLQNPDFLPGLSVDDRIALQQRAEAIKKDNDINELEQRTKYNQEDVSHATLMKATAEAELADGVLTKERLASIKSALLNDDYKALDSELDKAINEKQKNLIMQNEITQELQSGHLSESWSKKQLQSNYMSNISAFEQRMKRPASLPEKAMLTTQYGGRVTKIVDEMSEMTTREQDPGKLADLVKTFTYLETKNPQLLQKMDKDTRTSLILARENMLSRNYSPEEAFQKVRQPYLSGADKNLQHQMEKDFRNHMKNMNIDAFLNEDVFDDEYTSSRERNSLGLLSQNVFVDPRIKDRVQNIMKDTYMRTGKMEDAKAAVRHELKSTYGVTQVGNNPSIMFAPPEKMFPQFKAHEMREDLVEDINAKFGGTVDANMVGIMAVPSTRGLISSVNGKAIVQYVVTTTMTTDTGLTMQIPLQDPKSGAFILWTPSEESIGQRRKFKKEMKDQEAMRSAAEKRAKVLQLEEGF